ncbi:hypothetical protein CLOM_g21762 [Closterium sp. NIES-68]|nr:hypothetical protein CLOM_g21762 [Closterium sp. NIES-68]GJP79850.1 hypothetical protein CLOP_g10053 [Closterium sp. NIES-67]
MPEGVMWLWLVCVLVAIVRVNSSIPAIFTFGDSTADVGENNYLPFSSFKANFMPYGINYIPMSGRFSDGRLVGDFLGKLATMPGDLLIRLKSEAHFVLRSSVHWP